MSQNALNALKNCKLLVEPEFSTTSRYHIMRQRSYISTGPKLLPGEQTSLGGRGLIASGASKVGGDTSEAGNYRAVTAQYQEKKNYCAIAGDPSLGVKFTR
ncbi:unnamed protein product [Strongylus vulgaris]|uniref:Uncharacterized protein n=1 Tax=Strongylus vulgaris TaxID=40348 RepID=A0A3P7II10_STRVU|nr:unnamed protein product [Strongylus vulgaris]